MKPKQLKILATALVMVCLGAVVSVTAQNPTKVCGYFSAKTGFRVNTTYSLISAAFLTGPDRPIASCRAIGFCLYDSWVRTFPIGDRSLGTLNSFKYTSSPTPV